MSQSGELERVKARIRVLTERTISNGCTEAEAVAAAEMVGRLLRQYALSMDEVSLRQAVCVQRSVPLGGQRRRPIDGCVPAIARFCDCKVWIARDGGNAHYHFFGVEDDTVLAVYLYGVVERGMAAEAQSFRSSQETLKGPNLRRALQGYQAGMAARIAERLEQLLAERMSDISADRAEGGALIVVKGAVVDAAFKETTIRLVASRSRSIRANAAYRQGYAAGDRINLNRPIRGEGRGRIG